MPDESNSVEKTTSAMQFKAETRQLLNILIQSLYTDREIFLRELISNASDALTRISYEMLTNRDVIDPEAELAIHLSADEKERTLTIEDSGIGMNAAELAENLGTIAHSGAKAFLDAAKDSKADLTNIIGQFGVGFYSAFMVAESIQVFSRSYRKEDHAAVWTSDGMETFTVESTEKTNRGSRVVIKLKEDASEFLKEYRLREIVRKHSDYVPFPIYIGESTEQVNQQTAIWRRSPRDVKEEEYQNFYKQFTFDSDAPLTHAHMVVDAPVQMYALLFVPAHLPETQPLYLRRDAGLRLYARKVLIQDQCKDLLPEYLRFMQGVVDTEDLPLNVSRETVQSNRVMAQLKKLVTNRSMEALKTLTKEKPEDYVRFWGEMGRLLKEGVATEQSDSEALYPLLRFHSLQHPDGWISLDDAVAAMKPGQKHLYYILGEDAQSIIHSPHLDYFHKHDVDVLIMTDAIDSFMLLRLTEYQGHSLMNVASAKLELPDLPTDETSEEKPTEAISSEKMSMLSIWFKTILGDRVNDVKMTDRLTDSPARLVDPEDALNPEMQRVYRLLEKDYTVPKKILEINAHHPLLMRMSELESDDPRVKLVVEQIYEDALLIEGLHPDPSSMIQRIQDLMKAALNAPQHDSGYQSGHQE